WVNILGYTTNWCRPASGKKALANTHPLMSQLSDGLTTISKSQASLFSVNLTGTASLQARMASPSNLLISILAASGFVNDLIDLSRKRHRSVMPFVQSGINPSDASTTISSGDRPLGVACPRGSVSQTK